MLIYTRNKQLILSNTIVLGEQICPTVNASEGGLSQKSTPNLKLTSIHGIFSGSPSKGSKPKSSNAILRNKVCKNKLRMMFGLNSKRIYLI